MPNQVASELNILVLLLDLKSNGVKIEDETLAFSHKYQLLIFRVFIEPKG